ncbi:uncharacterized protein MONOS_2105 [Monocercomonoides exilis]|uniref:uncharacterized protein n=1 Tax=Monocercomonoides exilis TaxID=2049356 RepID=UPI00355A7BFC|nr:hypothetical protein MONOS_2105 [Monocercomonoides exilis]|eukprot:MONOS_2105.1-p1 / transcript=MONOS_2105.1 / gene=MONOS_2105 / organism=Monocercomonoides_exilis_PA203 / gene_product=unspecified product / transcript_product=unspecified product / location=Mono_scaffold00041:102840-103202(-) / protein_length=81 / sequence_SO=supercontig / SO=protein_coding / is_pseudo=false
MEELQKSTPEESHSIYLIFVLFFAFCVLLLCLICVWKKIGYYVEEFNKICEDELQNASPLNTPELQKFADAIKDLPVVRR